MNALRVASGLRILGALIVLVMLVRVQTLRSVMLNWDSESSEFFRKDAYAGDVRIPDNVRDAIVFAKVSDRIVQNKVLSHYEDGCGDADLVVWLPVGGLLLVVPWMILLVDRLKKRDNSVRSAAG